MVILIVILVAVGTCAGGGGDNAGNQSAPADDLVQNEDAAPEKPEPASEPIELSGAGPAAAEPFQLESGLAVQETAHQGQANFIATLLDESGAETAFAIGNEYGVIDASNAVQIPAAGNHLFDADTDGPWTIRIRQPRRSKAPEVTIFSGDSKAPTQLSLASSGLKTVSATHQGPANFFVNLLDVKAIR